MDKSLILLLSSAFQATFDLGLRSLQPEGELKFVEDCIAHRLDEVKVLKLQECVQKGVFNHYACKVDETSVEKFKESLKDVSVYKRGTCW